MQLADAIPEVLDQAVPEPDELAELLGRGVGELGGRWALLGPEAGQAEGIDGIGLRPLQVLAGEPMRAQWIDQRHGDAVGGQGGEQVLPVVAGRLHDDEVRRRPEPVQQVGISRGVLSERRRLDVCLLLTPSALSALNGRPA